MTMNAKSELQRVMSGLASNYENPENSPDALPRISIKERDRRYRAVRKLMAADGIDALILPANHSRWDQMMADSRYLTTIGGYGTETLTVFPLEGEVTAGVFNRSIWWKQAQDWVRDVRDCRNRWAEMTVDRLHEIGFPARGRIGISGLAGLVRAPDGLVPYTTVRRIKQAFPEAHIVDATGLMQACREIKSAEEIRLMKRSMKIIEAMLDAMAGEAGPGVSEKHLYATLVATMLENGGELPSLLIMGSGPGLNSGQFVPGNRLLQPRDMIVGEVEAHYAGYSGQVVQPLSLGKQPKFYMDLMDLALDCFHAIREKMRPGTPIGVLMDTYEKTVKKAGRKFTFSHPMMHARGLGDERPAQFGDVGLEEYRRIEIKAGMTFVLKPRGRAVRGGRDAQIGDTVVVTSKGGERLGTRELGLWVV